jgi:uncharacterized protein (DUF433 family)
MPDASLQTPSIPRHFGFNLLAPRGDAAISICSFVEFRGFTRANHVKDYCLLQPCLAQRGAVVSRRMPTPATVQTAHIRLDGRGVAWIDDTNTKVIEVAQDMIAHGWSPEEIHFQHPHLSLAQIHAALGFYYDHKPEMDAFMQLSLRNADQLREQADDSPIRKRLREMGKLA